MYKKNTQKNNLETSLKTETLSVWMQKKGFSIIESLVAVSILTVSITGATSIVQTSLQNTARVKAQAQAVALAIESVETVRHLHDELLYVSGSYEDGQVFYEFAENCRNGCAVGAEYVADDSVANVNFTSCDEDGTCELHLADDGYKTDVAGQAANTGYIRKVSVDPTNIDGGIQFKVNSNVEYQVKGQTESIDIASYLFLPN